MKPTYEELEKELSRTKQDLSKVNAKLEHTSNLLKQALDEIEKLKAQISKNSKNSSKPPSTDQKGNTDVHKPKKKRKIRKGYSRPSYPPEKIDRQIDCSQENCPHCGSAELSLRNVSPEALQQAEIPDVKAIITEYRLLKYSCRSCLKNSVASLPKGVPDSAFGPKLMGLIATFTGVFHLAKREAIQLIKDIYKVDVGIGSVPNIEEKAAKALGPIYERIHGFVITSDLCKHFDETGWRDQGKRHYVWLASCEEATVYKIDRHRSAAAFQKLFSGDPTKVAAVTDRYAVYTKFKVHQFCLAHLIRDFKAFAERDGPDREIGEAIEKALKEVCYIHKIFREGLLPKKKQEFADRSSKG